MSVQKNACYKDDAIQAIATRCPDLPLDSVYCISLFDFDVLPYGNHAVPVGLQPGPLKPQIEHDKDLARSLLSFPKRKRFDHNDILFGKLLRKLPASHFGLHGVYKFVAKFWHYFNSSRPLQAEDKQFFRQIYTYGNAASYRTNRDQLEKSQECIRSLEETVTQPNDIIRQLVSVGVYANSPGFKSWLTLARVGEEDFPDMGIKTPGFITASGYDLYVYKGLYIIVNFTTEDCYTFTKDDISRIEKFTMGIAWSKFYLREYSSTDKELRRKLTRAADQVTLIIKNSLDRVDKQSADNLCRAYDVALWSYLSRQTRDVNDRAFNQQEAKIRAEHLDRFVDIRRLVGLAESFPIREGLELLQIYKAFPQPDFDYFGAAYRQEQLYEVVRPFGEDVADVDTGPEEDLWKYFKFTLLRSFHDRHGVCPGVIKDTAEAKRWHRAYPYLTPDKIDFRSIDDIDMDNCFSYVSHGSDILDMVKDKAICPTTIDKVKVYSDIQVAPASEKNQLMDVLTRKEPPDMLKLIQNIDNTFDDVKAEDKAESKKPNGRWFFEAGTDRRLIQSEYEASIAEYCLHTAGCVVGKSTKDKINAMNYVCELPTIGEEIFSRPLMISFDLEKFSPSLTMDYHSRTDELFAKLFGQPHLATAWNVYDKGNVHYVKRNIHHSFEKKGRDFEGFAGKKNTLFHCAVMGYTVRRLRELGLIEKSGRFVAFVDDGLLRVMVSLENYDQKVIRILNVIEKVYNMANFYISWDKTFTSSEFSVFLNEFNVGGTPVTPGIRSFLKTTNRADVLCGSMIDDLQMVESTTRGAIAAGAPAGVAYAGYCFYVMDTFKKWTKGEAKLSSKQALAAFVPIGLGGFSCCSMLSLCGSVSGPSITEGIGVLRAIAVRFNQLAPQINKIVNVKMKHMSDFEKLRAPLAVRREGRCLKATRGKQVVERKLKTMIDTPVIRALIGDVSTVIDDSAVAAITNENRVPIELLNSIYASTIDSAISNIANKFLRAKTAEKLVPRKAFARATIANHTEAHALLTEWKL